MTVYVYLFQYRQILFCINRLVKDSFQSLDKSRKTRGVNWSENLDWRNMVFLYTIASRTGLDLPSVGMKPSLMVVSFYRLFCKDYYRKQ